MAGNITWSENHQGSSNCSKEGCEAEEEVLIVDLVPLETIKSNIEVILLDVEKYVKHKPSNEMYSASIHLEQFLRLLNN